MADERDDVLAACVGSGRMKLASFETVNRVYLGVGSIQEGEQVAVTAAIGLRAIELLRTQAIDLRSFAWRFAVHATAVWPERTSRHANSLKDAADTCLAFANAAEELLAEIEE